jgi:hypothetical protein
MKRWVLAIAAVVLFVIVPLAAATSSQTFGLLFTGSSATPPIEVGKLYGFGVNGTDLTGIVVAEPRGNWLKIEIKDNDKAQTVWINLLQVTYVLPDPPADKARPVALPCPPPACPPVLGEAPAALQPAPSY